MSKKQKPSDSETALTALSKIPLMDEKQRIELLLDTQAELNNGDAMAYFGRWLDAVCDALGIDLEPSDPASNPFSNGDT